MPRSAKGLIVSVSLIMIVPLVLVLLAYNFHTIQMYNEQVSQASQNTLRLYRTETETGLREIEQAMADTSANDLHYQTLNFRLGELDAHLNSLTVKEKLGTVVNAKSYVVCMVVMSSENKIFRPVYNDYLQSNTPKLLLEEQLEDMLAAGDLGDLAKRWFVLPLEGRSYYVRITGAGPAHLIAVLDCERLPAPQSEDGLFLYMHSGQALTGRQRAEELGLAASLPDETEGDAPYVLAGSPRQVLVSQHSAATGLTLVYATPYYGLWGSSSGVPLLLMIGSLLLLLLIPICYVLLNRSLFRPLGSLVDTMDRIREGDLDAQIAQEYRLGEFARASATFNDMIARIKALKISAYENQLQQQKAQLMYLQIQIRPHFVQNCLKSIYSLAEGGRCGDIQETVLALSGYMRNQMSDLFLLTPLEKELEAVQNYIDLQKTRDLPPQYVAEVQPGLLGKRIPPLSILTFVENAVKHASTHDHPLKISVRAAVLPGDGVDYINITVADNGSGFPAGALELLNRDDDSGYREGHIGIYNVKQRVALIYKTGYSFSFYNRGGACVDLFLPLGAAEPESEGEANE